MEHYGRELFDSVMGPKRFVTIRGGDHNDRTPSDPRTPTGGPLMNSS
jgi:hypothetical protein